jgi:hypothetical protein
LQRLEPGASIRSLLPLPLKAIVKTDAERRYLEKLFPNLRAKPSGVIILEDD